MSSAVQSNGHLGQPESSAEKGSRTVSKDLKADRSPPQNTKLEEASDPPPSLAEATPLLPSEKPPVGDDGWDPVWDDASQAYYFYNRFTQVSQWTNPRVPDATHPALAPGIANHDRPPTHAPGTEQPEQEPAREYTGYNPAIHGDYDPTAPYAQQHEEPPIDPSDPSAQVVSDPSKLYTTTGTFNRFTGKWQPHDINPENHNDENKTKRQMSAYFDVDAAANNHQGKSLKAERAGKKLSKQELRAFKEKRKEKKEEKRKAWLRD